MEVDDDDNEWCAIHRTERPCRRCLAEDRLQAAIDRAEEIQRGESS